jgi:hypothetical protein
LGELVDLCLLGLPKVDKSFGKQNFEKYFMTNGMQHLPINH